MRRTLTSLDVRYNRFKRVAEEDEEENNDAPPVTIPRMFMFGLSGVFHVRDFNRIVGLSTIRYIPTPFDQLVGTRINRSLDEHSLLAVPVTNVYHDQFRELVGDLSRTRNAWINCNIPHKEENSDGSSTEDEDFFDDDDDSPSINYEDDDAEEEEEYVEEMKDATWFRIRKQPEDDAYSDYEYSMRGYD